MAPMTDAHLIETCEDGVAMLTMNRPESLNALSGDMMSRLREAVPRLAADDEVRVVILTGAGTTPVHGDWRMYLPASVLRHAIAHSTSGPFPGSPMPQ